MILAVCLVILLFASDASCQTVVTYSSKPYEELLCPITDQTRFATWRDVSRGNNLANYVRGESEIEIVTSDPKHENFMYSANTTTFRLFIQPVEDEDGGEYECSTSGGGGSENDYTIVVEVIPDEMSLDCFIPSDVTCPAQGMNPTSELICTCAAKGVRSDSLSLDISGAYNMQQDSTLPANDGLFNLSMKATVPVTDSSTEVTCSVEGYNTNVSIPPILITTTLKISPPTCALYISFDQDCKVATLNCSCSANPTDGESGPGMVFSYFNETDHLIMGATTNPVKINDIEAGVELTYSCRGCNGLYYGDDSYATGSKVCTISTTALPTTTIVTTAPPSTNEPTSTKATESTTEELKPTPTNEPEPFPIWVIILIIVVVLAVVIAVIAVIMYKKGKCGSNSSSSSVTDVKVTATNSHTTNSEPAPAPVYGEIKKDRKKKSDKLDDNGAGPRGDPEIPAYGVVDKNRTKDPTPAPRSSMRDSKNPSNPKQDGPLELQYAALDHGNKPPSDEVRKPKEEPTEYATVQSVIV